LKSYLGSKSLRVQSIETLNELFFINFITLILRHRLLKIMLEKENATVIYGNEYENKIFIISSSNIDREMLKELMERYNLKGGGKGNYFMISIKKEYFKKIFNEIVEKFS